MAYALPTLIGAVLVVEDEPLLLMDAVDLMEDAGFTTYGASNAAEAIVLLERHPEIRVMFTDIDMPGTMDGLMLAKAVRDRWPPVAIIVTSGHVRIRQQDLPEGGVFFDKPYVPAHVLAEVRKMSAASPL
ncbi:transcriptional regulator [Aureimonas sp. Leaf454]|nr:transcriptional regulator [Aureimonas sp. Leaf454]